MLEERKYAKDGQLKETQRRSKRSWKTVREGVQHYEQGRYDQALHLLSKYESVEGRAMYTLACMYSEGHGVMENMSTAITYLRNIIKFPHLRQEDECLLAMAYYYLGDIYFRGDVVIKDDVEAETHWRKGALMGKDSQTDEYHFGAMKCQAALGMFYSDPKKQKIEKAFYWHKEATKKGSIISEGTLGVMYMYGIATEENIHLAYHYLSNAAACNSVYAKGYMVAFYYKRQMYYRAICLGKELASYEDYPLLAKMNDCNLEHVKQGIAVGCFYLALCMQYGYTLEKNIPEAKRLIQKALEISTDVACDLHVKAILCTA